MKNNTSEDIRKIFSKNLKGLIYKKGITQAEFSECMNINKATVSGWCSGTAMPVIDKIKEIADFFGISTSELLGEYPHISKNNEFSKACSKIGIHDERFCHIVVDYYNMTDEEKNIFCSFYEKFISQKKTRE